VHGVANTSPAAVLVLTSRDFTDRPARTRAPVIPSNCRGPASASARARSTSWSRR